MKKQISLVLVLSLILTMAVPNFTASAAQVNPNEALLEAIKGSQPMTNLMSHVEANSTKRNEILLSAIKLIRARQIVDDQDEVSLLLVELVSQLEGLYTELGTTLADQYGVSQDNVGQFSTIVREWLNRNDNDKQVFYSLLLEVTGETLSESEKSLLDFAGYTALEKSELLNYLSELRTELTQGNDITKALINKWNQDVLRNENQKTAFLLDLVGTIITHTNIVKTSETAVNISVANEANLVNALKELEVKYIKLSTDHMVSHQPGFGAAIDGWVTELQGTVNSVMAIEGVTLNANDVIALFNAIKSPYKAPPTPTPTPGVPTPIPTPQPSEPVVTIPKDTTKPVEVTLGEDAVEVVEEETKVSAEVKKEAVEKAIEAAIKATEGKTDVKSQVVITVPKSEGKAQVSAKLDADAIKKLSENEIDLVIKAGDVEYIIPAGAIDVKKLGPSGKVNLEFKKLDSEEKATVDTKVEAVKANPNAASQKALKVISFSLTVENNGETKNITKFNQPLRILVDISDVAVESYDNLGVYYVDEANNSFEFVGGKIRDNKIEIKTNHFSKYAVMEVEIEFSDIESHWAKGFIKSMASKHVIDGYVDGSFKPNNNITRAEFTKLVVEALGLDLVNTPSSFEDVDQKAWHSKYIATAEKAGLVSGRGDGTFNPNGIITRSEMAVILANALADVELTNAEATSILGKFKDTSDIPSWARGSVAKTAKTGLIIGTPEGKFEPLGNTDRGQSATVIYKLFNR